MKKNPFRPGVLVDSQLRTLCGDGAIRTPQEYIQPSSIDLALRPGAPIYRLTAKPPFGAGNEIDLWIRDLHTDGEILNRPFHMLPGYVYVAPVDIDVRLPAGISGSANPKSSMGRIDTDVTIVPSLPRGINYIPEGYQGGLYAIIVPQSFEMRVPPGLSIAQLRLHNGHPKYLRGKALRNEVCTHSIVDGGVSAIHADGVVLRLNLRQSPSNWVAMRTGRPLDLTHANNDTDSFFYEKKISLDCLFLEPGQFALCSTLEKVRIPPHLCAEMIAHDQRYGSILSHYAGFFDPGFGWQEGAHIVLEIRNIGSSPILLQHGQPIGSFVLYALSETPDALYGAVGNHYQYQEGPRLSKWFGS